MQLRRSYNRLRLYVFPSFYEQTGKLDMQPMLLCPRRTRFAPIFSKNLTAQGGGTYHDDHEMRIPSVTQDDIWYKYSCLLPK